MFKRLARQSVPWFSIGMAGIFIFSALLRFWGLSRFNALVFDEVYYAKFANNYLTGKEVFNAHPPLSQYIIAIGIWLGDRLPFGNDTLNTLTGSLRSTFSYRWFNAITGSFIPLVIAAIAYQLTHRRSYAFIAALLAAADGLFLVESRYALNNVYLVILGLLGQWFFLLALSRSKTKRWGYLALSGVFFGASACIKWNGLWFLLGAYMLWAVAWIMRWAQRKTERSPMASDNLSGGMSVDDRTKYSLSRMPLEKLTQLNVLHVFLFLAIIPILVYSVLWIPHLIMNPKYGLWEMQKEILFYHERIKDGPNVHPYCAKWYTWILMIRPIAYYYQTTQINGATVIYDVHAMGNPFLWWFSTAAIFLLLLHQVMRFLEGSGWKFSPDSSTWIGLYLVLNYAANLLPWVEVSRCTFMYHYMGAYVFAQLALAWLIDRWLQSAKPTLKATGITAMFLVWVAFAFWMPIYLGLPLSTEAYKLRMFFPSWI